MALLHELFNKNNDLKQKISEVYGTNKKVDEKKALEVNMEVAKLVGVRDPKEAQIYVNCLNTYWL